MILKPLVARLALCLIRRHMKSSSSALDRLLVDAIQLQRGKLSDVAFMHKLEAFFAMSDPTSLQTQIAFNEKVNRLAGPTSYKIDVSELTTDRSVQMNSLLLKIWRRRFGLLRHLGVRCDVLVLRRDKQIPPHGHHRVVSGFYVLDGEVAYRHYHRVVEVSDGLLVRKTVDQSKKSGGYSVNSEFVDNIHWLHGVAETSHLFRVTLVGVPGPTFGNAKDDNARLYIDPTGPPDDRGLVHAVYIPQSQVDRLAFQEATQDFIAQH